MQKLIDVWVCQNKRQTEPQLCVCDREGIIEQGGGWSGIGLSGEYDYGWRWLYEDTESFNVFYPLTVYPNKVRAKLLIEDEVIKRLI